jgi:hypothetical protein
VTRRDKLIREVLGNPKGVRFEDACRTARALGFRHESGRGSHRVFKRAGETLQLNFQNRDGFIPPYQARQLAAMIEKYGVPE